MGTKTETIKAVRVLEKLNFVKQQINSGKNFILLFIYFKIVLIPIRVCVCVCVCKSTRERLWLATSITMQKLLSQEERETQVMQSHWKTLTTSPDKRKAVIVNRKRGCVVEAAISLGELVRRTTNRSGPFSWFPWCDVQSIAHYQVSWGQLDLISHANEARGSMPRSRFAASPSGRPCTGQARQRSQAHAQQLMSPSSRSSSAHSVEQTQGWTTSVCGKL